MRRCSLFTPAARGVRWIHIVSSWGWILDLSQIHQIISPRNMESELNSTRAFFMYGWSWEDRTGSFWAAFFSIYREREKERKPVSEKGRRKNEQRGRDKGQRRTESLLQWFLDGFPIPSSMPLKEPAALCPQGTPASWQPTHLHPTHLFLKLVLTGFCCLQSKESLPGPLRTLIQIKEFLCPSPCFPQGDSAAFTHCLPSKLNFSMNKHKSLYLTMLTPIGRDENKTWFSFSDS